MHKTKLFCFPYAGGSASIYHRWRPYLDPSLELVPVELAGRGNRARESLYDSMEMLIQDLSPILFNHIKEGAPYALFGHSLGGLIVYELYQAIEKQGITKPVHLFISGKGAPQSKQQKKHIHQLPDKEFMEEIYRLGGTSREVLESKELLQYVIPILRKDYRIAELYEFNPSHRVLDSPVSILYGTKDTIGLDQIQSWSQICIHPVNYYPFEGGHFFINQHQRQIVSLIHSTLLKIPA